MSWILESSDELEAPPQFKRRGNKPVAVVHWQHVCDKLMEVYGVECTTDDVLNLDSSTDDRFSRHLIFNLRNAAFKDNTHVGEFRACCAHSLFALYRSESDVVSPAALQEGSRMRFSNRCFAKAKVQALQTLGWIQRQETVKLGESESQWSEISPTLWSFSVSLSTLAAGLVTLPVKWRPTDRRPRGGGARRSQTSRSCRWRAKTVRNVSLWILVRKTKSRCLTLPYLFLSV